MKLAPVPVDGLPPGALQLKVTGGVPPVEDALHDTAVPTVPVAGQLIVTTRLPPTVWVTLTFTPFESVTFSRTTKGPLLE